MIVGFHVYLPENYELGTETDQRWRQSYLKMSRRSAGEGTPISSSLSKRPGRLRDGSTAATRLVAAMTTTPEVPVHESERPAYSLKLRSHAELLSQPICISQFAI